MAREKDEKRTGREKDARRVAKIMEGFKTCSNKLIY